MSKCKRSALLSIRSILTLAMLATNSDIQYIGLSRIKSQFCVRVYITLLTGPQLLLPQLLLSL